MNSVKFELDIEGLRELMKSGDMQDILSRNAGIVQQSAGNEFAAETRTASYTGIAVVYPASKEGARKNSEENTLLKALQTAGLPMQKG